MIGPLRIALAALFVTTLLASGCSRQEAPTAAPHSPAAQKGGSAPGATTESAASPHGAMPTPHPPTGEEEMTMHGGFNISATSKKATVVVPPEVAGQWKSVIFIILDRERSKAEEVTVSLPGEYTFADGKLRLSVKEFLPDLRIDNNIYTSVSNEPNNPAAHVVIREGDQELFDGWLFADFPQVHKFEHPRFGITLKEGVPA